MLFDPFAPQTTERKKFNAELKQGLFKAQNGKCMYVVNQQKWDTWGPEKIVVMKGEE